jgi:hypothetical protein
MSELKLNLSVGGSPRIFAVDSGRDWAWAYVADRQLRDVGFRRLPDALPPIDRIYIERPHSGAQRASKKDLITLGIRAGEVGGVLRYLTSLEPKYVEPSTWKGSTTKKIMNDRVREKLSPEELKLLTGFPKAAIDDILDAIGIALYFADR